MTLPFTITTKDRVTKAQYRSENASVTIVIQMVSGVNVISFNVTGNLSNDQRKMREQLVDIYKTLEVVLADFIKKSGVREFYFKNENPKLDNLSFNFIRSLAFELSGFARKEGSRYFVSIVRHPR